MFIKKAKIVWLSCLAFILGIALGSYFIIIVNFAWLFFLLAILIIFLIFFWPSRIFIAVCLFGILFLLGFWRISVGPPELNKNFISFYQGNIITFAGVIDQEPEILTSQQKITISARKIIKIKNKKFVQPVQGRVLITAKIFPEYQYGDYVEITCRLDKPEKIGEFSYDRYLARYNIYALCSFAEIKKIAENRGSQIYQNIFKIKNQIRKIINNNLYSPESDLVLGVLLGDAKGFNQKLQNNFACTGLTHLVAVSGMNITILTVLIMNLFNFIGLGRRYSFYFALGTLIIYILLVGAPASAIRAGLMGFLVIWALYLGRLNRSGNALMLAAVIMLIINPKLLRDDIGFCLSFLAMASMIYIFPWLNLFLDKLKLPNWRGLKESVAITFSCLILTTPIIAYNFSIISLITIVANLLVTLVVPLLMASGIASVFFSLIFAPISKWLFFPVWLSAKYVISIANWLPNWPLACLKVNYLPLGWIILYYFIIFSLLIISNWKHNKYF